MKNTMLKTIGDMIVENRNERKIRLERQLDDIENWLLDNSCTNPDWDKKVQERNNISTSLKLI